jgi:hypothetical protein
MAEIILDCRSAFDQVTGYFRGCHARFEDESSIGV